MIICHTHKFIYVKSFKTASTSVERFFQYFCTDKDIVGYRGRNPIPKNCDWYNHMSPRHIKKKLNDDNIWDSYLKFGCIRNPWDRKVSAYFFTHANKQDYVKKTFEDFCMNENSGDLRSFYNLEMDYYIRFETLHEDIKNVCNLLNIPCDLSRLPHDKQTEHEHYTKYYTDKMRDKIAEDCKKDIEFFNYTFGD